ncbi:lecithin retinol acyltransferase family protein [Aeromonas bestiarum]|uniref:Lecithin retinol acyltransferase family protein n=1 Tax=Aeromonas bestiarum TaxID=105751 RepID=A0AAW7HY86_9GAMM|nr:lecithin retinol acyltransferase family protein [Aeromonas bestiarum]MDM5138771.1 lecithin retinol acyltransferase family protein [Aeromonas bestiarum]
MPRFTPGDHLVTARLGYTHHGLCVGNDLVIHYQGPNLGLPGEIVMTSLDTFSDGKPVWCKPCPVRLYGRTASIERARTRLGEHRYDVLFSNCEHFVMWCIHGLHHSPQISQVATAVAKAAHRTQQTTIMPPATTVLTRERTASDCMTLAITLTTLATSPSWAPLTTGVLAAHAVSRLWSWLTD